jgi:hypothetical protein
VFGRPDELEVALAGGRATPGGARVGDTVRRPLKPDSDRIHALLAHFERQGFGGAPSFHTIVEGDPEATDWADGELAYMERNAELFRSVLG